MQAIYHTLAPQITVQRQLGDVLLGLLNRPNRIPSLDRDVTKATQLGIVVGTPPTVFSQASPSKKIGLAVLQ